MITLEFVQLNYMALSKAMKVTKSGIIFLLVPNYLHSSRNYRQIIFNINDVVLIVIIC